MKADFRKMLRANYQPVLFVFLAFLAMVLVSYFYVSNIVRRQMLALGEETMNTTQTAVSATLSETELTFSNMTQTVESMLAGDKTNPEILDFLEYTNDYFRAERSPLPDFMKVYGYIRGEFLDGSGWVPYEGYDPPSRPWYIGADEANGKIYFTEPYIDAETGGMCISFSQEVRSPEGEELGILAIDLNLSRITAYVASQQITGNGYGVLLSDTLHFTTHRNTQLIGAAMEEVPGYEELAGLLEDGETINAVRFTDHDGTDSIAYFRTIFNGWHIGIITPRASYYSQVYTMGVVLGALGLVLMIALATLLVRYRSGQMRSQEESRSKSSFLARMSHEMRTPMNAIIGMTDIARHTEDPEKIQYCLGKIDDSADHLLGVINDILDMSKIEAGKLELSVEDFPLRRMLQQATTVTEFKIAEKQQHFTVDVDDDVPVAIVADRQRLAQVVANLLSNANKFTPQHGHIRLAVHNLGCEEGRYTLQFEVQDDGIGLSEEQQGRLFRSFEQADNSISRKYGGTGLGLAISKRIIELMDGEVLIESQPDKGANFIFTVRVALGTASEDGPEKNAADEVPLDGLFAGKHLLLAEDVEINREILATLLEDTGIAIDSAENGRQAVEMFEKDPGAYDMIFMDIHMPEVDGYEATRRIRSLDQPWARSVPIVAMTANVFREDIEKCLAAGMNDHVGKPIELDEVIARMKKYML